MRRQTDQPPSNEVRDLPVDHVLAVLPLETKYGIGDNTRAGDIACNDESTQWIKHFFPLFQRIPAKRRVTVPVVALAQRTGATVHQRDLQLIHVLLEYAPDLVTLIIAYLGCRLDSE